MLMPRPHASCLGISLACLGLRKTASASFSTSLPQSRLGLIWLMDKPQKTEILVMVSLLKPLMSDVVNPNIILVNG